MMFDLIDGAEAITIKNKTRGAWGPNGLILAIPSNPSSCVVLKSLTPILLTLPSCFNGCR